MAKSKKAKEGSFSKDQLNDTQKADFEFVVKRIAQLQEVRKDHYGFDLDALWAEADRDYIPHRLKSKGKKVVATDETKGWRGSLVQLGSSDWQSDISQSNPYIKIQTALSILVDQNPSAVLTPTTKKYQATNEIIKQLYERSWEYAKSKPQLRLFVFNLAKYGWACARTYPLHLTRKVKVLKRYNAENPENSEYEEKDVVEYNDIMRENLDPRNVWIDDMAKPNNEYSVKDWCWRKVYDFDTFKAEYSKYKRTAYVIPGGNTDETVSHNARGATKRIENEQLVEVYFYESKQKDLFMVIANGVPIIIEPLPIADTKGVKRLSLWQTYWNLRHAESPYGIGIYESIRYDQSMLDRIRNMTVDQLTLSIYKMFFYQGTQSLTDTGSISIAPGVGKQVLDPKNVNWLEVPGPGQEAFLGIDMFRKDVDEASGITDPLLGQVTGKTAFEIAQAKESALKRMKNPLDNILEALNNEGYITISLMQILYSIPETYEITDSRLIDDYLKEIQGDPQLYERTPAMNGEEAVLDETTGMPQETFTAKVYREFPLNLDKDEKGNLMETEDTQFFRIKPDCLPWEGVITVKSQSLLSPSKQIQKAQELEMYNLLIPVMAQAAQERMVLQQTGMPNSLDHLTAGKTIKEIISLYDKDPRDIIPDGWFVDGSQSLFVPAQMQAGIQQQAPMPGAQTVVPSTDQPTSPAGISQKLSNEVAPSGV